MLGVTDVRFIGLCDGAGYDVDELLRGIARTVGEFKPDVIFAPDQDVDSECHADHLNVGRCARQIACFAPYGGIMAGYEAESAPVKVLAYYMTARPNTYVASGGYIRRQLDAVFSCHSAVSEDTRGGLRPAQSEGKSRGLPRHEQPSDALYARGRIIKSI